MDDDRTASPPRRAPLARRTPVERGEPLETESPEVVDRVAALLGTWAQDDDDR